MDRDEIEERICVRNFQFGKNVYTITKEARLPEIIKPKDDRYMKRKIVTNMIS